MRPPFPTFGQDADLWREMLGVVFHPAEQR
jgi:hypothetical protein